MSNVPKNIENIIQDVINGVNNLLGDRVKKIILYGSYARGDYNKSSDIDIMILTDLSEEEIIDKRVEIWDMTYDIGLDNDVTISPLLKNIDDYNYWLDTLPFYMNVQEEGVILNG
jgi:predicted nucleotidyltransferase